MKRKVPWRIPLLGIIRQRNRLLLSLIFWSRNYQMIVFSSITSFNTRHLHRIDTQIFKHFNRGIKKLNIVLQCVRMGCARHTPKVANFITQAVFKQLILGLARQGDHCRVPPVIDCEIRRWTMILRRHRHRGTNQQYGAMLMRTSIVLI